MNLTLLVGVAMLLVWIVLVFVARQTAGPVHVVYAGAVILLARRAIVGAPKFLS